MWWHDNRPAAPSALDSELRNAFRLLARHPLVGSLARPTTIPGVRRLLLPNTRYYIYYQMSEPDRAIEILSFWNASRGAHPKL
jgi:plasmid stabilization system protein ParE